MEDFVGCNFLGVLWNRFKIMFLLKQFNSLQIFRALKKLVVQVTKCCVPKFFILPEKDIREM